MLLMFGPPDLFWSSVDLTGNQTIATKDCTTEVFWSSVDLTGNQTSTVLHVFALLFWSSVDLTGNQTGRLGGCRRGRFGAVSI